MQFGEATSDRVRGEIALECKKIPGRGQVRGQGCGWGVGDIRPAEALAVMKWRWQRNVLRSPVWLEQTKLGPDYAGVVVSIPGT